MNEADFNATGGPVASIQEEYDRTQRGFVWEIACFEGVGGRARTAARRQKIVLTHHLTGREARATINHMVKYSAQLDATFAALADPTRRAIVARLARGEASVGELARPFDVSLPAVS